MWCMASFKEITSVPNIEIANIFYRILLLTYMKLTGMGVGVSISIAQGSRVCFFSVFMGPVIYCSSSSMLLVLNPWMASLAEVVLKL